MMKPNISNTTLKITAGLTRQFPRESIPQAAFSGRSNVGKSSLINSLINRKSLARVSSSPGKTVTVNFYSVDGKMFLVDLPGYGYAKRSPEDKQRWSELTDGYFTNNPNVDLLKLVVQLIDMKVGPTNDDAMMLNYLRECGIPYVVAATKADKLNKTEFNAACNALKLNEYIAGAPVIPFSSVSGIGRQELWDAIFSACNL